MAPSRPGECVVLHSVPCWGKDDSEQHVVGSQPVSLRSEWEMGCWCGATRVRRFRSQMCEEMEKTCRGRCAKTLGHHTLEHGKGARAGSHRPKVIRRLKSVRKPPCVLKFASPLSFKYKGISTWWGGGRSRPTGLEWDMSRVKTWKRVPERWPAHGRKA